MEKIYVVTLHRYDDLEGFYDEMKSNGYRLSLKRPISRNTHYWMTDSQAVVLRQDSRVLACEQTPEALGAIPEKFVVNKEPYTITGSFWKEDTVGSSTVASTDRQWGQLHCAGTTVQRRKGTWGVGSTDELVTDTVSIYSNGKHVDVVICDDPVSYDCEEWYSPSTNQTRFVQYDWFNNLNSYVSSIDDDGQTLPTGATTYYSNSSNPEYHGVHVAGTVAGQHYGWAREANIYGLQILGSMPSGQSLSAFLLYDYLRAFHRHKPLNQDTGRRNPTVTNHSWGYGSNLTNDYPSGFVIGDITSIVYNGVTYNSGNPGPSGWTMAGVEADFGIGQFKRKFNYHYAALNADVEDAIEDGVVIIGAAGNNNFYMVPEIDPSTANTHVSWNNRVSISGAGTYYYNRGSSPNNTPGVINVGALSNYDNFRRSTYTNFGSPITVFAPGDDIISAFNNTGLNDSKYSVGSGNYYYPISGTSMASPQVAGIAAILAGGKHRFTNEDMKSYLQKTNIEGDMTFDSNGGDFADLTCQKDSPNLYITCQSLRQLTGYFDTPVVSRSNKGMVYPRKSILNVPLDEPMPQTFTLSVSNSGSGDYVFTGDDRNTTHSNANDPTININQGDILDFSVQAVGHPFWIKTVATTGTGDVVTTGVSGAGTDYGNVSWDTTNITAGTYYYQCQFHAAMSGSIVVS